MSSEKQAVDTLAQRPSRAAAVDRLPAERGRRLWLVSGAILVAALGATVWGVHWLRLPRLPPGFASGNGRIEATEYDIAAKYAGRVVDVHVHEGDLVEEGQVLARMDTEVLEAERREAMAQLEMARQSNQQARAVLVQRESERRLARVDLERTRVLVEQEVSSIQQLDHDRTRSETAEAAFIAARERVHEAESSIAAAAASLQRIQTQIEESTLVSPIRGRVIYRLAEPGEVLGAGGKVVTIVDLTDVYMTIFLPTEQAGRVAYGAEARMVLDALPEFVLPASVSFVSPEAQFTPKEVETRTEREKLMFRFKVRIEPALLEQHLEQVKTGVPGVSYVRLADGGEWPEHLAVKLPPS